MTTNTVSANSGNRK